MKKIAILASGSGSNAENICLYFARNPDVKIELFLTNNAEAGIIKRGKKLQIPTLIFGKSNFSESDEVVRLLQKLEIDFIVLAGFLWLIPNSFIRAFPNKIVNIHPALLPKYGGKGMWGHHVHEAVVAQGQTETGMTIHLVNEKYDEGKIIFQAKCPIAKNDSAEMVAEKVLALEHHYYPTVIEELLNSTFAS